MGIVELGVRGLLRCLVLGVWRRLVAIVEVWRFCAPEMRLRLIGRRLKKFGAGRRDILVQKSNKNCKCFYLLMTCVLNNLTK